MANNWATEEVPMQKSLGKVCEMDLDDEETTDIGQGSASETESASGLSCDDNLGRRCRFGKTTLETIPATPSHSSGFPRSPPGLSRASMRQVRDACKSSAGEGHRQISMSACMASNVSRFGASQFETVPKTPVGGAKLKAYKKAFGSPPGLSRTELRRTRDACKVAFPASTSWGSCQTTLTADASGRAPREALLRIKQEAARLKDLKEAHVKSDTESLASPSRAAMRQARDSCKSRTALTISSTGQPMTPPTMRTARQRAARDAASIGQTDSGRPFIALSLASSVPR